MKVLEEKRQQFQQKQKTLVLPVDQQCFSPHQSDHRKLPAQQLSDLKLSNPCLSQEPSCPIELIVRRNSHDSFSSPFSHHQVVAADVASGAARHSVRKTANSCGDLYARSQPPPPPSCGDDDHATTAANLGLQLVGGGAGGGVRRSGSDIAHPANNFTQV